MTMLLSNKSKVILILAIIIPMSTAIAVMAWGDANPTSIQTEPDYSTQQTFNQSLTIDNVTVVMDSVTHSSKELSVSYSYSSNTPGVNPQQMINGKNLTRADGNMLFSDSPIVGAEVFPLDSRIPGGEGELVDVSLGTYLIPANLSGNVTINLGAAYKTATEDPADGSITVPLNAAFSIEDRNYRVAQLLIFPTDFRLWIEPVNDSARRTALVANKATLTDNDGNIYQHVGGDTAFDNLSPRGHKWHQIIFIHKLPESATSLTLDIQGGETVVGPFVFENVHIVSENAPVETPQAPGDPAEGTATPVRATEPTQTPTATSAASPTPTSTTTSTPTITTTQTPTPSPTATVTATSTPIAP